MSKFSIRLERRAQMIGNNTFRLVLRNILENKLEEKRTKSRPKLEFFSVM